MRDGRITIRDHFPGLDLFTDWIASEDHFGTSLISTSAIRGPTRSTRLRAIRLQNSQSFRNRSVPASQTWRSNTLPRYTEVDTQTASKASPASSHTPTLSEAPRDAVPTAPLTVDLTTIPSTSSTDFPDIVSDDPAIPSTAPVPDQTSPSLPLTEPATPPEVSQGERPRASESTETSSVTEASTTFFPNVPSHRQLAPGGPRSRLQVGRSSYELLWREYLALTAEEQQQQQFAAARPIRYSLSGSSSRSSGGAATNNSTQGIRSVSDMTTPAPSTILQGPLSYDKPKGLGALLLPLLCPPTDFLDLQSLTKLLIRVVVMTSSLLFTLSFIILPAWLWLLRHELLQGHSNDGVAVLVIGLVVVLASDWVRFAASKANSACCAGVFTATARSDYQLSALTYTGRTQKSSSNPKLADRVGEVDRPESYNPGLPDPANGAAASVSRVSSHTATRNLNPPAANVVLGSSRAAVDPLVRQVKQRIIKLERILFGNELTEADISRDALGARVQMLYEQVGVPLGGPGGSSTRPTLEELEEQLKAVESALGVI